ncbi:chemotaxis protein CheW [Sandaracinus amylolyticus]|uniref:Positive regulator of CheA protein activity n=1 Tax=Sandaracinus amylolyticus TaxID=927083 RepID=A0A0F6W4Q9_9BACT|nr:chemotaxis protein CheW [Sandaracinus amylolyticus]AKF07355.1 Positive regulator of CheA protein activity [Sandaracinus amylolyticus]
MSVLHVLFRVGDAEYAIAADEVLQMESYDGATPVPNAAAHVAGIVQVRGRVVPVVDLRVRFNAPVRERTIDTRVVVAQRGERAVALLVDAAREVARLAPEQLKPPPPMVAAQSAGFVRAIAQVAGRMVMLIDLDRVVGEERLDGE